jgi:hypothetical protein
MSNLTRELIPVAVMYGFVLLLAPAIGYTMWIAFEGDQVREAVEPAELDAVPSASAEPGADGSPASISAA